MPQPNVNTDPAREAAEARAEPLRLAREQASGPSTSTAPAATSGPKTRARTIFSPGRAPSVMRRI